MHRSAIVGLSDRLPERVLRSAARHPALVTPERAGRYAVVAIPANNEAERIGSCLAALALQRDATGVPLRSGSFEILVFANNCSDTTVEIVAESSAASPHPITVVAETLPPERSNAGWARKRAMDLAAARLAQCGRPDGLILTTDADSRVAATWIDATWGWIAGGADCVAGYVDPDPLEILKLGRTFIERGRLEDRYIAAVAALYGLCDPRPHDPWPNHRASAGVSLAVTRSAYEAVGGLPVKAVGEDAALTLALEDAGLKVRHALDVSVTTSCRLEGRVDCGAAATMRYRHETHDAPCDADLEPAFETARRALLKGRLRRLAETARLEEGGWARRLGLTSQEAAALMARRVGFESFWLVLCDASPRLRQTRQLRPSDLPREIARAEQILRALRRARDDRADRRRD